jgi:ABC-type multidrug transport system ATPase subunit
MLVLSRISKKYANNITALQDVSLTIPAGMFGLLGPNGAGKSTLMRTIATLQDPDSGSIHFNDIDVRRDKQALRATLGYLPQEFGAYPRTSAQAMLLHLATLKGIHGRQRSRVVENVLVQTNLWEVRNRSVDKYSGGMKQRFGIAQALLGDPGLLIVDEPTAGLDPAERRRFQNLLAEIAKDRVVLLSTHIVDDVAELCPGVAIMGRGRILKSGEPRTLIAELKGALWTKLVSPEERDEIRQTQALVSSRFKAGRIEVRVLAKQPPPGMTAALPELEDVYFATLIEHGLRENLD